MSNNALSAARIDVWLLKEIRWQPKADEPSKNIKIVMQTLNGPCSFIALCNILILRGDIEILPLDRQEAAYEFLSSLVGDYLLRSAPDVDITSALSILPMTQNGLDLNPLFTGASTFRPTGDGAALELFKQTRIELVHGWLCDPASAEYPALLKTQDYDSSIDLVVEADSLTKGKLVTDWEAPPQNDAVPSSPITSSLSPEDQRKVENAISVRRFLDGTQSQLTYYGLFNLSSQVDPGKLVALFRNSHLSVLYRPGGQVEGLFTLVTDHTFAREETVVWEKLDDIEGSSQFVDSDFKDAVPVGGDYAGETAETVARAIDDEANAEFDSADLALAQQLQAEEDAHAQHMYEQRRIREEEGRREQQGQATPPRNNPNPPPINDLNLPTSDEFKSNGKKKKDCIVM